MATDIVKCETCGLSGAANAVGTWHPFLHSVNVLGAIPSSETFGKTRPDQIGGSAHPVIPPDATVTVQTMPFDPVLRQALIDKGILTPEDLREAENKIRAVTGQFQEAMQND